jgi:hypothetical protein
MNKHIVWAGCMAAMVAMTAAGQDEAPARPTEADYAEYARLRMAHEVANQKDDFARGAAEKAAVQAEFEKACASAGWTAERYEQVDEAVDNVLSALAEPENYSLDDTDEVTVATVKAHRKELDDFEAVRQRAADQVKEDRLLAKRGAPATPAELNGTWVLDIPLTLAGMTEGASDELKEKAEADYRKTLTGATYTFGPGDRIKAVNQRPGQPPETTEGRYRLDGAKLTISAPARAGGPEREDSVDVGIKDGRLLIGKFGFYSVFRRE